MRHLILLSLLLAVPVTARAAAEEAEVRGSCDAARQNLASGRASLRELAALAQQPKGWDRVHPLELYNSANRAIEEARKKVGDLASLSADTLREAAPAVKRAAEQLDNAESDLRALAAPVRGLAVSPEERAAAIDRLARSVDGAADALEQAEPVLRVVRPVR